MCTKGQNGPVVHWANAFDSVIMYRLVQVQQNLIKNTEGYERLEKKKKRGGGGGGRGPAIIHFKQP